MGKLGKARKRRRVESALGVSSEDVDRSDGESEVADQVATTVANDMSAAIAVLDVLAQRTDLYFAPQCKGIRIALSSLIQASKGAHFEPAASAPRPSDATAQAFLQSSGPHMLAFLRLVSRLSSGEAVFSDAAYKPFRRALHPLVLAHIRKEKEERDGQGQGQGNTTAHAGSGAGAASAVPAGTAVADETYSLSGRISIAFRHRDWSRALALLRELACSGDGHRPRLGAMQRWVRDCDLATHPASGPSAGVAAGAGASAGAGSTGDVTGATSGGVDGAASSHEGGVLPASAGLGYTSGAGGEPLGQDGHNTALLLLDAVMRAGGETLMATKGAEAGPGPHRSTTISASAHAVSDGVGAQGQGTAAAAAALPMATGLAQKATLVRHPLFTVLPRHARAAAGVAASSSPGGSPSEVLAACAPALPAGWSAQQVRAGVRVISHVPGPQRRPPSEDDLNVYMTAPGAIVWDTGGGGAGGGQQPAAADTVGSAHAAGLDGPTRHDVPGVPGAFLMSDVLSPSECAQLLHTAEGIGYTRDGIDGIGALVWLADDSLLAPMFDRVKALLPQSIAGCAVKGINARWRLFRYSPGAVYRPHIDGAWPGSGIDAQGNLTDDAFPGKRISRLTFLVYLNGGFPGGATTFFLASPSGGLGCIDARGVEPQAGSVLCFPHGDAHGSLVHEGSAVHPGGVKYIIRTDVLYATEPE